ncbi:MAG: alpha/beta fold hydrolase [Deltaproteobacteria bacterium]|nr:alpha/beta fold hydrolase [Deltaproteobacteria bacterium]
MFARAAGRRLYFELRGDEAKPTLVLIRGLGRNALHWGELVSRLERSFYLLLFDNRGVGRSDRVARPFSVTDLADDVAEVMDAAKVARAHVLGTSLGGMVAMRFAIEHGPRLDRLVLVSTTPGGRAAAPPKARAFARMAIARLGSLRDAMRTDARFVLGESFAGTHPAVLDEWQDIAERYPVSRRALVFQALAARLHDASRELDAITAPTLVLSCRDDKLVPAENSRLLARGIRGSELTYFDGDSHELGATHLEPFAGRVEEFLLAPVVRSHAAKDEGSRSRAARIGST